MKREASHTKRASASNVRMMPEIGRVEAAESSLAERLAGKVSDQLGLFAAQMAVGVLPGLWRNDKVQRVEDQWQVELPEMRPTVTRFRVHVGRCGDCGPRGKRSCTNG